MQPFINCPKCGAETVGVTCLDDTRWQFLCVSCGATVAGEPIDPAYAAAERAKVVEALCAEIRRRDCNHDFEAGSPRCRYCGLTVFEIVSAPEFASALITEIRRNEPTPED